jgi:universal stress protein A
MTSVPEKIQRILVPVDFSEGSRAAIDLAQRFAETFLATIDLLHVWEPPPFLPGIEAMTVQIAPGQAMALTPAIEFHAARDLNAQRLACAQRGLLVGSRLELGNPAKVIARLSSEYDLVVMGTHGRTAVQRFLIGSVAERVVRTAKAPVLIVPLPKARTREHE